MTPMIGGYIFLGVGPTVTGENGGGWSRSKKYLYACSDCGGQMPGNHDDYFNCHCGNMHLDYDYGRFGHTNGDDSILVYQKADTAIQQIASSDPLTRSAGLLCWESS